MPIVYLINEGEFSRPIVEAVGLIAGKYVLPMLLEMSGNSKKKRSVKDRAERGKTKITTPRDDRHIIK